MPSHMFNYIEYILGYFRKEGREGGWEGRKKGRREKREEKGIVMGGRWRQGERKTDHTFSA